MNKIKPYSRPCENSCIRQNHYILPSSAKMDYSSRKAVEIAETDKQRITKYLSSIFPTFLQTRERVKFTF